MTKRKESSRYEPTKYHDIERDKRSGIYYFRATVARRFVDKSLKTKSLEIARGRADAVISGVINPEGKKAGDHTFDQAFDIVITLQSAQAPKTTAQAKTQIAHLRPWFKANCPLLKDFVDRYEEIWAEYRIAQKALNPTRKLGHDRRYLVMALTRAENRGWIKKHFTKKHFKLLEASKPVGQYIEDKELKGILFGLRPIDGFKLTGRELSINNAKRRIYLQVLLAATTAMRPREILQLSKPEVNLKKREIDLDPERIKTRRPRRENIPIPDVVYPLLKEAYEAAEGKYLFPKWRTNEPGQPVDLDEPQGDNRYYWKRIKKDLGIEVRWYDLRHTAISNMLASGLPETFVSNITGATRDTIARIYAHLNDEIRARFRGVGRGLFVENEKHGKFSGKSATV